MLEVNVEDAMNQFKENGEAGPLIEQYRPFINKYVRLFSSGTIDYRNYDIRSFIACYMPSEKSRQMRKGKYHTTETKVHAAKILHFISRTFAGYEKQEIENELMIPLMECAHRYTSNGRTFADYLYRAYRFYLYRHIQKNMSDSPDNTIPYDDDQHMVIKEWTDDINERLDNPMVLDLDDDFIFNDPSWLEGKKDTSVFQRFRRDERLILAKYYYEGYTDKKIGQLVGRNPKSINRVRNKMVDKIQLLIQGGEVKCLRWVD